MATSLCAKATQYAEWRKLISIFTNWLAIYIMSLENLLAIQKRDELRSCTESNLVCKEIDFVEFNMHRIFLCNIRSASRVLLANMLRVNDFHRLWVALLQFDWMPTTKLRASHWNVAPCFIRTPHFDRSKHIIFDWLTLEQMVLIYLRLRWLLCYWYVLFSST